MSQTTMRTSLDWRTATRGRARELARYCDVPFFAVVCWRWVGVPRPYRAVVQRFARMAETLLRHYDERRTAVLLRLAVRASENRRRLARWEAKPTRRAVYRVSVRN